MTSGRYKSVALNRHFNSLKGAYDGIDRICSVDLTTWWKKFKVKRQSSIALRAIPLRAPEKLIDTGKLS